MAAAILVRGERRRALQFRHDETQDHAKACNRECGCTVLFPYLLIRAILHLYQRRGKETGYIPLLEI